MMRFPWISLIILLLLPFSAHAQSTWEVTPYQVRVWWVSTDAPELPESWSSRFDSLLARELRTLFAGVCETTITQAPDSLRLAMRRDLSTITRDQLLAADPELTKIDKLFLISIRSDRQLFSVELREFDGLLTHFGPTDVLQTEFLRQVVPRTTRMMIDAFSPVVRIDRAADDIAKTRLRAGALMRRPDSPGSIRPGDVLLPFDRRVQSSGKASVDDIRPIDWTYLQVPTSVASQGVRSMDIVSGYRQPFRSKRSRRQQQYAIRTRPTTDQTTIRLLSRSKKAPLAGYEIHEKGESITRFLGYTNWLGELTIPKGETAIRTLLVRSGARVLAKLPIVPGLRSEVIAYLRDDRLRVEADGFLSGVQLGIIDLVARRESLTTRIRNRIAERDFETAEQLLNELRDLPTRDNFRQSVDRQLGSLNLADSNLKTQINTTFVQTVSTLGKYLDPNRARELEAELNAARGQ